MGHYHRVGYHLLQHLPDEENKMTVAWIAVVVICTGAFLYGLHLGKKGERK